MDQALSFAEWLADEYGDGQLKKPTLPRPVAPARTTAGNKEQAPGVIRGLLRVYLD